MISKQRLEDRYKTDKAQELILLERMGDPEKKPEMVPGILSLNQQTFFLKSIYVDSNNYMTRLSAYLSGKCKLYSILKTSVRLEHSSREFGLGILSDNENLIQIYANFTPIGIDTETFRHNLVKLFQKLIKQDFHNLKEEKHFFKQITGKERPTDRPVTMVIEGFMEKDEKKINEGILGLLLLSNKREHITTTFFAEFMDLEATVFAKLAVRAGFEITIDHELLPKDILPIEPLEEYPQYKFLDEFDKEMGWK